MSGPPPVLIAGGGIGGLALALALARRGWPSVVAERRSTWSDVGAGIQLSPNGVAALRSIGIADRLAGFAARPREIVVREAATSVVLQRLPLGDWIEQRHGAPYWLAHRRDLQAVLVAAVAAEPAIRVELGFEVARFALKGERVELHAASSAMLEGVALVGADGVFSQVRQQLWATPVPSFAGRTASRTVIPVDALDRADVIDSTVTGVWLAPGAHVVHYPVRGGSELAVVAVRTEPWQAHGWSEPVDARLIAAVLAASAPALAKALGHGHEWRRWALFDVAPLAAWSDGPVTLLGDAAHPTLPFLAQGGSLALEDAVTLAAHIARTNGTPAALADAFRAYQQDRRGRTARVVAAARRNGRVFHLAGAASMVRNAAMRLIPGKRVMAGFDWVYGWRPTPLSDGS